MGRNFCEESQRRKRGTVSMNHCSDDSNSLSHFSWSDCSKPHKKKSVARVPTTRAVKCWNITQNNRKTTTRNFKIYIGASNSISSTSEHPHPKLPGAYNPSSALSARIKEMNQKVRDGGAGGASRRSPRRRPPAPIGQAPERKGKATLKQEVEEYLQRSLGWVLWENRWREDSLFDLFGVSLCKSKII